MTYGNSRIPYGITPPYGYHWTMCERIISGKPIIRWNKGENKCNMMRVEDFAIAFVGLLGNPKAYGEAFNICGDEIPSFNEVLDCVSEYLKKSVHTVDITSEFYAKNLPSRAGEILGGRSIDAINSNEKIKATVSNIAPNISLKDGVFKTLDAYKNNNYQKGISFAFDGECDRIISKWCKKNGISIKGMSLKFVDYHGNASRKDKIDYLLERYKDNYFVIFFLFVRRCVNKMKNILKKNKNIY